MDALEALLGRRSIRKFQQKAVPPLLVEKLLRAAMNAPSARHGQPWHFVVVADRALLDTVPSFSPHAQMAREAPLGILVCADTRIEKSKDYWPQDCSNATMNILLAAHALGLGAVWTAAYPRGDRMEGFRRLFSLPPHIAPFSFVPIGYPDETPQERDEFDAGRVHENNWQAPYPSK